MRIAGIPVRLDIADARVGAALLPALHHHLVGSGPVSEACIRVVVWTAPLEPFPWRAWQLGRGGAVPGLTHGPVRAIAAADGSSLMLWDGERRTACCWYAGLEGVTRWDRAAPFRPMWHFALASPQRQLVHGAVVGRDGRGVLLAGPGGCGKSTTTLACLEAGLQVVGDDYTVVDVASGSPRAWSVFRSIKVGERSDGPAGTDGRRTLIIGDDLPGQPAETLDLVAVLLPRVVGGVTTSLSPVTAAAALRALAPSTLLQAPFEEHPALGILPDVARALPSYQLNLGADRGVRTICEVLAS